MPVGIVQLKVIVISDTHNEHYRLKLPPCDLLIHAGDFTVNSTLKEIRQFSLWFSHQDARHKLVIAGNHEHLFAARKSLAQQYLHPSITYLHHSGVVLPNGLKVWGSAMVPRRSNSGFLRERGELMRQHWERMPEAVDLLITHAPPHGILDINSQGEHCGCEHLREKVKQIQPKVHVFGHIHQSHGHFEADGTRYYNAAFLHKKDLTGEEYHCFEV